MIEVQAKECRRYGQCFGPNTATIDHNMLKLYMILLFGLTPTS